MTTIKQELDRVRQEIAALQVEEGILHKLHSKLSGEPPPKAKKAQRAVGLTPIVLDVMRRAGAAGATSTEVAASAEELSPGVAKTSVAAILSRLKGDGALAYVGDRYFEKQFAPSGPANPFDSGLRAVN